MRVNALFPLKAESERLKGKNFRDFCGQPLYRVVLDTLEGLDLIENIFINTDSEIIASDCKNRFSKAVIIDRPSHLTGNEITMNSIIEYDLTKVKGEHFLQTHCTNPLITSATFAKAIEFYFGNLDRYDSLFSVEEIKKRAYLFDGTPVNHQNQKLEQTQHLPGVYIENSNIFIFSRKSFANASNSRVGLSPFLFAMSSVEGIDIDYLEDFVLAELIQKNLSLFTGSE